MTKIKYIHCFGTSFTAGGGFEFESEYKFNADRKKEIYKNVNEEFTQYNFSWPGQLQKLVGDDQTVLNHGKQGYGNDRMIRLAYDIINQPDFKPNENLLILEFAGLGRLEFFLKDLDSYIVCNYQMNIDSDHNVDFNFIGSAKSYNYDDVDTMQNLEKYDEFFETYVNKFIKYEDVHLKIIRDSDLFLSYLKRKNINFIFSIPPLISSDYDDSNSMEFGDGNYFKKSNNFVEFMDLNKLSITDETKQKWEDGHCGIKANKIIAECVYNKLVDSGYNDSKKNIINWEWYHKKDFLTKLI